MTRRAAPRALAVTLALLAAGCGADDPITDPPTDDPAPTSTTAAASITTTQLEPAGFVAEIPEDWTAVADGYFQPDIELIDPGDDDRTVLSYGGDGSTRYDIDIDDGNQGHRTAMRGTSTASADGLWISIATVDSDDRALDGVAGSFGVTVAPTGAATIHAPTDRAWGSDTADAIWAAIVGSLVRLPAEPVGIGATWRHETDNPEDAEFATVFSVMDIKGPLVTIGHGGVLHGGVTTIDTASGRMIGHIETDDGVIVTDSNLTGGYVAGLPVALEVENEVTRDGEPTSAFTASYFGTSFGPIGSKTVPDFRGLASAVPLESTPVNERIESQEQWERSTSVAALNALFDQVLPEWAVGPSLIDRSPEIRDSIWLQQVGVGGSSVAVDWEIIDRSGSTITVRVDETFEQEEAPRGFRYTLDGTVSGEVTVDRFHPWDIHGDVVVDFEIRTDDDVTAARQVWRADPAPIADRTGWRTTTWRAEPPVAAIISGREGPDIAQARSYGGGEWSGSITIDQAWTRQWGHDDGADFRLEADIVSRLEPDGQWIEFTAGSVRSSLLALSGSAVDLEPLALVAAPTAVDRVADQVAPPDRPFPFYEVLAEISEIVTPTFPADPIVLGAQWTNAPANQLDLITATYTLVAIEGNEVTLQVVAPADAYYGDRYGGWTIDADLVGEVTLDLAAAVVLSADLVADGTATFGTAGERDPSTTEPWRHTLTITTEAA